MGIDKADLLPQRKDAARRAAPRSLMARMGLFLLRSREASIAIAGIVLIIYFQSTASAFLSPSNIGNLAEYTAMTAIIAVGLVMVLISGEVDLSVGPGLRVVAVRDVFRRGRAAWQSAHTGPADLRVNVSRSKPH